MENDYNRTEEAQVDETASSVQVKQKRKLNIVPKIICLLLAVLIWYAVTKMLLPAVNPSEEGGQASAETDRGSYRAYFVEIRPTAGSDEHTQAEWGLQQP